MTSVFFSIAIALLGWMNFAQPAAAAAPICRSLNGHNICILSIQRSAKYPWEYRAAIRIDAQTRPIEKYNCRDRLHTQQDGRSVPFEPQGAGELICRLAHQKQRV
ncbi:MAG: hypothetical protein F6K28_49055 [Microcoleus sp. SIO2G3]|nr:hypothetical protein [Microcoleus sp. SIO2G3]